MSLLSFGEMVRKADAKPGDGEYETKIETVPTSLLETNALGFWPEFWSSIGCGDNAEDNETAANSYLRAIAFALLELHRQRR